MRDYGKKFEDLTKVALINEGACVDRLPDQMTGRKGSTNPSDYTAYKKPYYYYIECKSCQKDKFDIKAYISEDQWIELQKKLKYKGKGVFAGYLVWFVQTQDIFWISASAMAALYSEQKSFTPTDAAKWGTRIPHTIKNNYPQMYNILSTITKSKKK